MRAFQCFTILVLAVSCFGQATQTVIGSKTRGIQKSNSSEIRTSGKPLASSVDTQPTLSDYLQVAPVLLDQLSARYVYGTMVANQTLAIQVSIMNFNEELDLLVQSIVLRETNGLGQMAALDKRIVQGLAQRGQSQDARNIAVRVLKGIGASLAPFPAFINVGHSFSPAVAAFNGPGMAAIESIFPDHTTNQLIRISNHAFDTNQVITKNNAANVTIFVPASLVLSKEKLAIFKDDPFSIYGEFAGKYVVEVKAVFIEPADEPSQFAILSASFNQEDKTITLKGAGFRSTDTVSVSESDKEPTVFGEPDVEYRSATELKVKLSGAYLDKLIKIRVARKNGGLKSNVYAWETK
jgi:hypothetical protein